MGSLAQLARNVDVEIDRGSDLPYAQLARLARLSESKPEMGLRALAPAAASTRAAAEPIETLLEVPGLETFSFPDRDALVGEGRDIVGRFLRQAHDAGCGEGDDFKEDREAIQKAIATGIDELAAAVSVVIANAVPMIPAAVLVFGARIVAKLLVKTGYEKACDATEAALKKFEAATPAHV